MSRFYGSLRGSARTEATRRGTANAPAIAHVRGWDIGARVAARPDYFDPEADAISVELTSGSNDTEPPRFLVTVRLTADGPEIVAVGSEIVDHVLGR